MPGLTSQEVMVIVNRWIGVQGGYLGDFSYRTHAEFYPEYCGVDADPYEYEGTTRERFIQILSDLDARSQARVVRGVIERFPINGPEAPKTRDEKLEQRLLSTAERIERDSAVAHPSPAITSDVVRRALDDAETLIGSAEAGNAVDRIHTALHGYLLALCEAADIKYPEGANLTRLFTVLRTEHPALQDSGLRRQDVTTVLRSTAAILDSFQPIRNQASLAHPNPVLDEPEAFLMINAARTLFHYLDKKLALDS